MLILLHYSKERNVTLTVGARLLNSVTEKMKGKDEMGTKFFSYISWENVHTCVYVFEFKFA